MNIMNKLTLKHIRQNKKRTILTIIGIILSVAMFTAVSTGLNSCLRWMENLTLNDTGRWQVNYQNVPAKNLSYLQKDEKTAILSVTKEEGYGIVEDYKTRLKEKRKDNAKPYIYLSAYDSTAFKNMGVKLVNGQFPKSENEIVLPENMLYEMQTPYKVGDTITFSIGKRILNTKATEEQLCSVGIEVAPGTDNELTQSNEYLGEKKCLDTYTDDSEDKVTIEVGEKFEKVGEAKTYKIVGIVKKAYVTFELPYAAGYSVYTYLDPSKLEGDSTINAYVYTKNVTSDIYEDGREMAKKLQILGDSQAPGADDKENPDFNGSALIYRGVTKDDNFNTFINVMTIVLDIIIMVGSVSLIYNSFAISISERSKQLGMLSSVGATRKQKRNSVLFEAGFLGIIGIPLGIVAGILGLMITFKFVNPLFSDILDTTVELSMYCTPKAIIIPVVCAIVTIFISAYIPAIRASKITPMEALRQSKDVKITAKAIKTSKLTRKIFGFEGEIALKNMKRNKKRYRSLIFSLFISVVLFISVASYIDSMTAAFKVGKDQSNFDVYVECEDMSNEEFYEIESEINDYDSVKQTAVARQVNFELSSKQKENLVAKDYSEYILSKYKLDYAPSFALVSLDDESFKIYCKTIKVDPTDYMDAGKPNGILINYVRFRESSGIHDYEPLDVKAGQEISLQNISNMDTEKGIIKVTVGRVTKELPLGIMGYCGDTEMPLYLVVPESVFAKLDKTLTFKKEDGLTKPMFYMLANEKEQIVKDITSVMETHGYAENSYRLYSMFELEKATRQIVLALSIFAYGFIILMSLICCANMCNTISTSITLRRKEFCMLRSVGMTPKVFRRMIMYESLLYGIKSLLYGIPVSILIAYAIYRIINPEISIPFRLPLNIIAIAILVVFAVVGTAMMYSSRKVRKETIIDGLREEIL